MNEILPDELTRLLWEVPALGRAYLVGGCVRDWLLGVPGKDIDVEVYGLDYEELLAALKPHGRTDLVGRSFGVIKLTLPSGVTYDFSVPRRDSKVSAGHKGFLVAFDKSISPEEAAARRDFTINALMYDPREARVLDFFGGQEDLRHHVLRHTSAAFTEDPLRVLRGMQFAARFDLVAAPETVALCREIRDSYRELARERVREEWFKWAAKSVVPSRGLAFLEATSWLGHFPEIASMRGTPQDPVWHPEGDVFTHTCHCCDAMAQLPEWRNADETSRIVYSLAILAHDFGKPETTQVAERKGRERVVSPGHEDVGGRLAETFLERINAPTAVRERVIPLVTNHMFRYSVLSERAVRRLARRLSPETVESLCVVMTADAQGRPPLPRELPEAVRELRSKARDLQVEVRAPQPILLGRHLLERGCPPGRMMGELLNRAFEAQLDGEFEDLEGGLNWLDAQKDVVMRQ